MSDPSLEIPFWIEQPPFYFVPICHYRIEFAEIIRFAFHKLQPAALTLELPESLDEAFLDAIGRLPEISVILHQGEATQQSRYLLVEPADAFVEAARLARADDIPCACIDLDLDDYGDVYLPVPDTYAIIRIGHRAYYQAFIDQARQRPSSFIDQQREQGMAMNLQKFHERTGAQKILVVCGMSHVQGIIDNLELPAVIPLGRKTKKQVQVFNVHPESTREILYSYGFLSAMYEYARTGLPKDIDLDGFTVRKQGRLLSLDGLDEYFKPTGSEEEALKAAEQWAARHIFIDEIGPGSTGTVASVDRWDPKQIIDRQKVIAKLFHLASLHYNQDTGETVQQWQHRIFNKFARNYTLLQGNLLPDFFHLLVAARSCIDDNFGYAFWRLGTYYPWQKDISDKPTIRISGDELFLGSRKILIQRFIPNRRQRWNLVPLRTRPHEKIPGEWLTSYDGDMICSYPPEDIEIENWGGFIKKKASRLLSIEKKRTEPFTTSILDGIDIRETIRNYYQKKIYVQEFGKIGGDVGSIVVIFQEDDDREEKYPFIMTWLGESYQEGDMALYATHPLNHVVGPGISRCEYGGFMMSYPPFRLFDIWSDPVFDFARTKPERLLAAAIDYSLEKYIVYVAPEPPRPFYKSLAGKLGRNIVFLPLSTFSPPKLRKLRVFHILSGHDRRESAPDYIW